MCLHHMKNDWKTKSTWIYMYFLLVWLRALSLCSKDLFYLKFTDPVLRQSKYPGVLTIKLKTFDLFRSRPLLSLKLKRRVKDLIINLIIREYSLDIPTGHKPIRRTNRDHPWCLIGILTIGKQMRDGLRMISPNGFGHHRILHQISIIINLHGSIA